MGNFSSLKVVQALPFDDEPASVLSMTTCLQRLTYPVIISQIELSSPKTPIKTPTPSMITPLIGTLTDWPGSIE